MSCSERPYLIAPARRPASHHLADALGRMPSRGRDNNRHPPPCLTVPVQGLNAQVTWPYGHCRRTYWRDAGWRGAAILGLNSCAKLDQRSRVGSSPNGGVVPLSRSRQSACSQGRHPDAAIPGRSCLIGGAGVEPYDAVARAGVAGVVGAAPLGRPVASRTRHGGFVGRCEAIKQNARRVARNRDRCCGSCCASGDLPRAGRTPSIHCDALHRHQ
jgi:hypothetical protein